MKMGVHFQLTVKCTKTVLSNHYKSVKKNVHMLLAQKHTNMTKKKREWHRHGNEEFTPWAPTSSLKLQSSCQSTRNMEGRKEGNKQASSTRHKITCLEEPFKNKMTFVQKGRKVTSQTPTPTTIYCLHIYV